MRMTREELIKQYPYWNEDRHDIVKAMYGDIPLIVWDKAYYESWSTYDGTCANIDGVNAYMYSQNGDYYIYRTLIGEIFISTAGKVLGGSITVKYRGISYTVALNLMYGWRALDILKLSGEKVRGFSNKDGTGSPSNSFRTEELDRETIEKILSVDISDYGESVHSFITECTNLYNEDSANYIMEKTFNM